MEALFSAVQAVFPLVGRHAEGRAVDRKARPTDAVGAASDGAAEAGIHGAVAFRVVIAEANVRFVPVSVRHEDGANRRAIGQQFHRADAVRKLDQRKLPAAAGAERLQPIHGSALIAVGMAAVPCPRVGNDLIQPKRRMPAEPLGGLLV